MPLTTIEAMLERMVTATENLLTNIPQKLSKYLPLSGGTMSGDISSSASEFRIKKTTDTGTNVFMGGSSWNKGGYFTAYGKDNPNLPGGFACNASDGTNIKTLQGRTDGTLYWAGKTVALCDNPGTVSLGTSYTASWTATESNAIGQQLTGKIENVSVGVYIIEAKLPGFTNNEYFMALNATGASFVLDSGMGKTFTQQCVTRIIKVTSETNAFWLTSGQSATCEFSYLERGGLSLTRIG